MYTIDSIEELEEAIYTVYGTVEEEPVRVTVHYNQHEWVAGDVVERDMGLALISQYGIALPIFINAAMTAACFYHKGKGAAQADKPPQTIYQALIEAGVPQNELDKVGHSHSLEEPTHDRLPSRLLECAFVWASTPQGVQYWMKVVNSLRAQEARK